MDVDIVIDKLTDCLEDTRTGAVVKTYYRQVEGNISRNSYERWKFNWQTTQQHGYDVYDFAG